MSARVLGVTLGLFILGCGGGKDGKPGSNLDGGGPPAPTFTNVMKFVITSSACGGPFCHQLTAGGFQLGTPAKVYAQLINQEATGALCRAVANDGGAEGGAAVHHIRVIPNDPEHSLLYQKLAGNPPCGDPMPKDGIPDDAHIQLVHDWIANGAQQD